LERLESEHISFEELIDWISISDFQSEYPDIRLDNGYFYMVLAKDERGDCVFASRNQHTLRCTIHGRHPILCKIYPFDPIHRGHLIAADGTVLYGANAAYDAVTGKKLWTKSPPPREAASGPSRSGHHTQGRL